MIEKWAQHTYRKLAVRPCHICDEDKIQMIYLQMGNDDFIDTVVCESCYDRLCDSFIKEIADKCTTTTKRSNVGATDVEKDMI